jgi:hypothetical protein
MEQRLAIIAREIAAMTDDEQAQLFKMRGVAFMRMFRQSVIDAVISRSPQ